MLRLNLFLLCLAIVCALAVVTSQHKARKHFIELQAEKDKARQMEVEWGQLQLEQSTLALPARVEKIASHQLQMQMPQGEQIQFVRIDANGVTP
ncbi:MAG: cell division protein FtsL [Gallionellaceae bacterium]|nr:MAG: cell division protein FtsL [Gallionellaceae bacterium]